MSDLKKCKTQRNFVLLSDCDGVQIQFIIKVNENIYIFISALIKQCYGDYGCFAITNEWISLSRPISVLPQAPKAINVKFCLYTPESLTDCQVIHWTRSDYQVRHGQIITPVPEIPYYCDSLVLLEV